MIEATRGDKVLYPDCGLSKADVLDYFGDVSKQMLPHLMDRFLTLHRFPDGIDAGGFYQQERSDYFSSSVRAQEAARAGEGDPVRHMYVNQADGLLYLADQGTIAFHGWQSRRDRLSRPDRLVFDLDPAREGFKAVIDAAKLLHEVLPLAGLTPFVMTTGSRGLHVVAPLQRYLDFEEARDFARRIAQALVARAPDRFTREQRKKARRGRLYLDIGRNAYGQTAIVPYSLRALPGAPVATPLEWSELNRNDIGPQRFRLKSLRRRLGQKDDPWRNFFSSATRPRLDDPELKRWMRSGS